MLSHERLVAFLSTADAGKARAFYEGLLGLTLVLDHEYLMFFDSGPARVALQKSPGPVTPPHGTALGWNVGDLRATMRDLAQRGVAFERGDNTDESGVWSPEPGQGVAWFFDPDGNRLSVNGPI